MIHKCHTNAQICNLYLWIFAKFQQKIVEEILVLFILSKAKEWFVWSPFSTKLKTNKWISWWLQAVSYLKTCILEAFQYSSINNNQEVHHHKLVTNLACSALSFHCSSQHCRSLPKMEQKHLHHLYDWFCIVLGNTIVWLWWNSWDSVKQCLLSCNDKQIYLGL